MSEKPNIQKTASVRSVEIRARARQLRDSRKYAMLGVPEIVGLICSGIMLIAVAASYFYFLTPARARLKSIQDESERLRARISAAQQGVDINASPQATVDEIAQSLERFERENLLQSNQGRMALYTQLNEMLRRHKLRNTAGPVYAALDPLGGPGAPATAARAGNARWQTLYPGIGIAVTVEGPYSNLRRFLTEVETNRHFFVINSVELEGAADADSKVGAALVSLRVDMATYFQRENAAPDATPDETR